MPDTHDDLIRDLREPLAYVLGLPSAKSHQNHEQRFLRYERLLARVDAYLHRDDDKTVAEIRKIVDGAP